MKPIAEIAPVQKVVDIAIAAGKEILEVYADDFVVETKGDGSPLTIADRRADDLIRAHLQQLTPDIPLLSEESAPPTFAERKKWQRFWLVDPLDGTKSFARRQGEFTVNIALMEANRPVLGVVYEPLSDISYYAAVASGAFKRFANQPSTRLCCKKLCTKNRGDRVVMVASHAHARPAIEIYRRHITREFGKLEIINMSSSKKICIVAEGLADIYPRLGPTSEWDTAAAQCILEEAGGHLTAASGEPLRYNKADLLNPWFIAYGDSTFAWHTFAQGIESPCGGSQPSRPHSAAPTQ